MYRVKYVGSGQIEVNLPSYPAGVVIKHGDYARLNLNESDKRVINSLKRLGLSFEEEEAKKVEKKPEPVKEQVVEKEAPAEEPAAQEVQVTKEDLMKKPAAELKKILKETGFEDVDGKSKSELADIILEKVNG